MEAKHLRTLVPLPALQSVDFVTVDDHSDDFVFVYFLDRPTCLRGQALFRVAEDKIDLPAPM